jgi:hypothetical protein
MNQQIKGVLTSKGVEQIINDKLTKREFVIKTEDKYPKDVCFTLINSRVDIVDPFQINEVVEISYSPESRNYNDKWYTQLVAWKIEKQSYNAPSEGDNHWEGDLPY